MRFLKTPLSGAYVIELDAIKDERGFFARSWCRREFEAEGIKPCFVQCNVSFNRKKGTLRGMHFQRPPKSEAKLVRCTRGAIFDVIIDLRPGSLTTCKWTSVELTESNLRMIYIPEGFAHGFQTLADNTEVFYQMSDYYFPEYSSGVRWNDPSFGIVWPFNDPIISEKDSSHPLIEKRSLG